MSAQPRARMALLISAAAHAALFGALLATVRPPAPATPLSVHLLELSTPPKEAPGTGRDGASTPEAPAAPVSVQPSPAKPRREAAVVALTSLAPEAHSLAPAATVLHSEASAGPGGGVGEEGTPTGAAFSPGGGLSGPRYAELHRRLAEAAARCYPAAARRFRLKGEVPLRFCLDASGTATALGLVGSTGSSLLDTSALECVVPGAQPLSGFEGCFLVPVRFGG